MSGPSDVHSSQRRRRVITHTRGVLIVTSIHINNIVRLVRMQHPLRHSPTRSILSAKIAREKLSMDVERASSGCLRGGVRNSDIEDTAVLIYKDIKKSSAAV